MTDRDAVLALDIGGTKMASAVVARDGTILARGEVPTRGGAEQLYVALVALSRQQIEAAGATVTDRPHDRPWGIYSGYFRDLDGHLWEIMWSPQLEGI